MSKRKMKPFTIEQKLQLIRAVQKFPNLWHDQKGHVQWKTVASQIKMNEVRCKDTWTSLRQSFSYHCKKAVAAYEKTYGKTDPNYSELRIKWMFAPYMCFLAGRKFPDLFKATFDTPNGQEKSGANINECSMYFKDENDLLTVSHYTPIYDDTGNSDVQPKSSPSLSSSSSKSQHAELDPSDDKIQTKSTDKLTDIIKQFLKRQEELTTQLFPTQPTLQNYDVFAYWDAILNRMSTSGAQSAKFAMTELLQDIARNDNFANADT